jgi:hypothetical protein
VGRGDDFRLRAKGAEGKEDRGGVTDGFGRVGMHVLDGLADDSGTGDIAVPAAAQGMPDRGGPAFVHANATEGAEASFQGWEAVERVLWTGTPRAAKFGLEYADRAAIAVGLVTVRAGRVAGVLPGESAIAVAKQRLHLVLNKLVGTDAVANEGVEEEPRAGGSDLGDDASRSEPPVPTKSELGSTWCH